MSVLTWYFLCLMLHAMNYLDFRSRRQKASTTNRPSIILSFEIIVCCFLVQSGVNLNV